MKKIIYSKFGGTEVLQIIEVPIPIVRATAILIKLKTASSIRWIGKYSMGK